MTSLLQQPAWKPEQIARLNQQFRSSTPADLLTWVAEQFGTAAALTCSFGGPGGMVLLDLVARQRLPIEIIFIDTGLLFPETYALAEQTARRYGITLKRQVPTLSMPEQESLYGPELYARDPDRCCELRKVVPLTLALKPYRAWVSAIRRDQTSNRANAEPLQWNQRHNLLKLNPLAYWSEAEVWAYIHSNAVPYNPLLDQGYNSLGCAPCTRRSSAANPRDGRWQGFDKTECGIHL